MSQTAYYCSISPRPIPCQLFFDKICVVGVRGVSGVEVAIINSRVLVRHHI